MKYILKLFVSELVLSILCGIVVGLLIWAVSRDWKPKWEYFAYPACACMVVAVVDDLIKHDLFKR